MNGDGFAIFGTLQGIFEEVDIRKIRSSSFCYRSGNVQNGEPTSLASSIEERGLLQPITVRIRQGLYEIVSGNRRFLACKQIGLRKIVCNVVELDDKQAFETSLIENLQRRDLSPIDEARGFKEYSNRYGRGSISALARRIGRSVAYVDKRIRLLELPPAIIDMISCADLSVSGAEELLPISAPEQQFEVAQVAKDNRLSIKDIRGLASTASATSIENRQQIDNSVDYNNTTYYQKDRWNFETRIVDLDVHAQKSYDKAIIALRTAMNKLISIMDNIEDNWIIHEMLRQHKEVLHNQIDLLIKERQKI